VEEQRSIFAAAVAAFDACHREDHEISRECEENVPRSLHYHQRLTHWVNTLSDTPSEALQLAARAQHIHRWKIPRSDYPLDRAGYKQWRSDLAGFHAELAERILADSGYDLQMIERVRKLLFKVGLKSDPEVQLFEDAICLVFLENEFTEFSKKHDEEKLTSILQKTWRKMSSKGHSAAMSVVKSLSPALQKVVTSAVSSDLDK